MTFLLLVNDLKFGSLFCYNGYRNAIFIFNKSLVEYLRKAFTKEKEKVLITFLLLFYYIFMT